MFDPNLPSGNAETVGLVPPLKILPLWRDWVHETFTLYDAANPNPPQHDLYATFDRWMFFNEPFLRGLYPWNTVTLLKEAKDAIADIRDLWGAELITPVYIGGVCGSKGWGRNLNPPYTKRNLIPFTPLERHWALLAYGAGEDPDTGEFLNESLAFHLYTETHPESRFLGQGYAGILETTASFFSLARFWGMDPARVTLDEASIASDPDLHCPAEVQANYVDRTLLLLLSSGYLDAIHIAFEDQCPTNPENPYRPGIARHRAPGNDGRTKPGFYSAKIVNDMLTNLAFESSLDLEEFNDGAVSSPLFCLRYRDQDGPDNDQTTTAIWSANSTYEQEGNYGRVNGEVINVPVRNNELMTAAYRKPAGCGNQTLHCADPQVSLPVNPGGIVQDVTVNIVFNAEDQRYYAEVPVTGAPIYLRSELNAVATLEDRAEITTLAGLKTVWQGDGSQNFKIDFCAENDYPTPVTVAFIMPHDWHDPVKSEVDPNFKGLVTVHPVSRSLQDLDHLQFTISGDTIFVHAASLRSGSQFSVVYGDSRASSTLLDMGPFHSGPVDLDFLKFQNWMTYEAAFAYRNVGTIPAYTAEDIRAGWGSAPDHADIFGEREKQVRPEHEHSATGIYRDFAAMAMWDDLPGRQHGDQMAVRLKAKQNTQYILQVYLNDPDSDFEECDPADPDCYRCLPNPYHPGVGPDQLCMTPSIGQQVRIEYGNNTTNWHDSSADLYFDITTGGNPVDEEIRVVFKHAGNGEGIEEELGNPGFPVELDGELDNLIFCYGLELREKGLGGGPGPSAGPRNVEIPVLIGYDGVWTPLPEPMVMNVNPDYEMQY